MKVLVLGVGHAQHDVIQYCKEKNYTVYAVSMQKEGSITLDLVDYFDQIDIRNKEEILHFAKKNKISRIYTVGTDFGLITQSHVCEKLHLPCHVNSDIVALLTHKRKMRDFLKKYIGCIHYKVIRTKEELKNWSYFPAVMKPVDNQGQRGVILIQDFSEISEYFDYVKSYSTVGEVIIEEFIPGQEVSVSLFISNSRIEHIFFADRISLHADKNIGIVCEHRIPTLATTNIQLKIKEYMNKLIQLLHIKSGPLLAQLIYNNEKDSFSLIELTPRIDGAHLPNLIKHAYNIDLLDLMISSLEPHYRFTKNYLLTRFPEMIIQYFHQKPGTIFKTPRTMHSIKNIIDSKYYYHHEEYINLSTECLKKTGHCIMQS